MEIWLVLITPQAESNTSYIISGAFDSEQKAQIEFEELATSGKYTIDELRIIPMPIQ
jgi:hypothetical protein